VAAFLWCCSFARLLQGDLVGGRGRDPGKEDELEGERDKREKEYYMGEVATEGRMQGGTPGRR
jgi:hypothetical protein